MWQEERPAWEGEPYRDSEGRDPGMVVTSVSRKARHIAVRTSGPE
jgi:hypothetical protein